MFRILFTLYCLVSSIYAFTEGGCIQREDPRRNQAVVTTKTYVYKTHLLDSLSIVDSLIKGDNVVILKRVGSAYLVKGPFTHRLNGWVPFIRLKELYQENDPFINHHSNEYFSDSSQIKIDKKPFNDEIKRQINRLKSSPKLMTGITIPKDSLSRGWIYFSSGDDNQLIIITSYRNYMLNGSQVWYLYGYPILKRTYKNSKIDGKEESYHYSVSSSYYIARTKEYIGNEESFNEISYYENGNVSVTREYSQSTKIDTQKHYNEFGVLLYVSKFNTENGLMEKNYYQKGTITKIENYKKGKLHGKVTYFDEKGMVIDVEEYEDGKKKRGCLFW